MNLQFVRSIATVMLADLIVMYVGILTYYSAVEFYFPDKQNKITFRDFAFLELIIALSLLTAAFLGWRLAQKVVAPMEAASKAARSIASGNLRA